MCHVYKGVTTIPEKTELSRKKRLKSIHYIYKAWDGLEPSLAGAAGVLSEL